MRAFAILPALCILGACSNEVPGEGTFVPAKTMGRSAAVANGRVDVEGGLIAAAAKTPGTVSAIYVQEGERVTKGQPLAQLEFDGQAIAVTESEADIALARTKLDQARLEATAKAREYSRLDSLRGKRAVAGVTADLARDDANLARLRVRESEAALAKARAAMRRAVFERDQRLVRSPADGTVAQSFASVGTGVSTLNVSVLFTIVPNTPRIVRAEVTETALRSIRAGQAVKISPENERSASISGTVKRIAPIFGARRLQSDQASQLTDERVVEVIVQTRSTDMLIGQRVLVRFE
ncbi:HlyD family efflux transporter periplasmic adaptor subunit [Sphingomonas sp. QA11]|uniref:HlyD family secretion protein n=1 Tax=Sphingomonas sp. QA11 TaxID=2950605 RepID=UPI002349A6CD|nr:HlyD family efflux transporter periplasmic adaptor subunit [Sphingomonas sp. QA11]WCM26228.1 HlyD family efflux transporter periplasmic adaptor subunit [Sphingomonas sp. QA11]